MDDNGGRRCVDGGAGGPEFRRSTAQKPCRELFRRAFRFASEWEGHGSGARRLRGDGWKFTEPGEAGLRAIRLQGTSGMDGIQIESAEVPPDRARFARRVEESHGRARSLPVYPFFGGLGLPG